MTDRHKEDVVFRAHTAFKIGEIDLAEKLILSLGETLPQEPSIRLLLGNIQGKGTLFRGGKALQESSEHGSGKCGSSQ